MSEYFPPKHGSEQFHCPYCNVYANQHWDSARCRDGRGQEMSLKTKQGYVRVSICTRCSQPSFWLQQKIIYPPMRTFPAANSDLSDGVKKIYDEAATIASLSPRAACALLRLATEMLLEQLGETGDLNKNIKKLVGNGLNIRVQQSLDIVRVTGNNAIHPGKIEPDDITDTRTLFDLINLIADALITQPKRVQAIYDNIPEESRKAIEERDGKSK